ncbi:MAG TPA: undecaprenyldiphospho-muramoylpentapeptide beta-N-acetylglucosaminyltransferase [Azospirillaceae bacterium]|nr:undecaprenyldiphospho-muramoylpentapeptide beta-N-acetylglucosaminyltransferase [Azospirillaceae bacterium]
MNPNANGPILLAAGGTGGHLFPAEALARELIGRGRKVVLVTDRRGGTFASLPDVAVERIRSATVMPGLVGKARTAVELAVGTLQALRLIARLKPAAVVGFGGYPSLPTGYAARRTGVPLVLHEQNAVLGRANRLLAPGARRICTSFGTVAGLGEADRTKLVHTGNPVRSAIAALRDLPYPAPDQDGPFRLLVTGGSQGAKVFSEVVPEAVRLLPGHLRARLSIVQQARPETLEAAQALYADVGARVELAPFFADMADRLAACHLMICRGGASTVTELAAAGRPAILIPYPHAIADEQTANAEQFAAAGGGWVMPQSAFTPEALAARLQALMTLPETLSKAAAAARTFGIVDAAARLADTVVGLLPANGNHADRAVREAAE